MKFIQFRDPSEIQAGQDILFSQPCYGQTTDLLHQFKNNQAYTYYGQEWRWGSKADRANLSGVRCNADVSQHLIATLEYSENHNLHSSTGRDFRRNMPQFLTPQYRARPAPLISPQTSTPSYVVYNRGAGTLPLSDQYDDQSTLYVVLNLANAFTPGGSAEVPDTGVAQEESLIRNSNALLHMPMGTYGDPGRRTPSDRQDLSSPLAETGGTYRLDNLSFIDSTRQKHQSNCSMIFAAAPDLRNKVGGQAQKDSLCTHQGFNNFTAAVLNNIRMTLDHTKVLAERNNHLKIELDLGALGCGVFQNPSLWVSALYRMALDEFFEENEALKGRINVSFSILGDDNLGETFQRMMNADINEVQSYLTYASDDWLKALDQLKGEGDYQPNRHHADQHRAQAQALELKEQTITPEMLRDCSTQNIKIDLKAPKTRDQQVQIVSTDSSPLNFKNIGLSILAFVCSALLFTTPTLDLTVLIGASILAVLGLGLSIFSVYKALKPFNPCTQFSDLNQIGGLCYKGTCCYLAFPNLHDEATLQAIFTPLGHQAYCHRFRKLVQPLLNKNPTMDTDTIKQALKNAGHPQHLYEPLLTSIQLLLDTPDDTTLININKQLHYGSTEYEQQLIASTKRLYNKPNRTPLEEEYLKQQQRYFQDSGLISVQIEDLIAIGFSNPQTLQLMGYSRKAILEAYRDHPKLQENLPRSAQLHLQFEANTSFAHINQKYCNAGFFSSKPSNLIELFKEDCPPHQQINPMYYTIEDLIAVTHKSLNEIVSQFSQSSEDHPQLCEQQLLFLLKIKTPIHQLVNRRRFNAQAVKQALLKTERHGIQVEFQNDDFAVCLKMGLQSNEIKMIAKGSFSSALTAYLKPNQDPTNLDPERMKHCVNQGVCFNDISEALTEQDSNQLRDQYFTALSTMEPSQFKEIMLHSSDTETGQTQCINTLEHLKCALECYVQPKTLLILFENLQPAKSSAELAAQLFTLIPEVQWKGDDHPSKLEALKKVICFVLEHHPNPTGLFAQSDGAYNNEQIETRIAFKQWFESSCHTTKVIRLKQIKANQQAFEKNQQALKQNQQALEQNQQAHRLGQQAKLHREAAQYSETQASLALRQESLTFNQEALAESVDQAEAFKSQFKSEGFTLTDFKEADYSADELGQKLSGLGYTLEDLIEALISDPTPYWFEVAVAAEISFDSLDFMAGNAEVTAAFIQHLSNSNFQHVKARYSPAIDQSSNVKQSIYNELINRGISLKVLIQITDITYDELKEYTTPQFWIFTTRQFSDEDILTAITSIMTDESSVSWDFLEELSHRGFDPLPDMNSIRECFDLKASTQTQNQTTAGADLLTGDMGLHAPSVFQADSAQSTDSLRPVTAQDVQRNLGLIPPQDEDRATQSELDQDETQSKSP